MIISHKHKFIFLHTPKTAGSSICEYFSQFIGDDDILNGWNHSLRKGIPYNRKTLSMVNNKFGLKMISKAINLRKEDKLIFDRPIIEYAFREILKKKIGTSSRHATANHLKNFDEKAWKKYFKFAFVRNPYTQALSAWLFEEKKWSILNDNKLINEKKLTKQKFIKWLKNIRNKKSYFYDKFPASKIYTLENKIAVDYIGKFENLRRDVLKIKKILKLPKEKFKLEHTKKNTSKNHLKYYNNESKELVKKIWAEDLEFFKYSFPDNI